jgi:hypothetical protein
MRRLMQLADDTKITKKFLRESMTMAQYEVAWQHYSATLKKRVEEDVLDYPPPGDRVSPGESKATTEPTENGQQGDRSEPAATSEVPADGPYATTQQIAQLKRLAQQVGDEAYANVPDMLEHYQERIAISMYEDVKQRLKAGKAAKKAEATVERAE